MMAITCLLEIKTYYTTLGQKSPPFNKYISLVYSYMLLHFQVKIKGWYLFLFPEAMNLANPSLKLKFFSLMSTTYYVVTYFRNEEKNKNSVTLHSDMKQNIFIPDNTKIISC